MSEYRATEQQLDELEQKLLARRAELNHIAQILGKPLAESERRLSVEIIEPTRHQRLKSSTVPIARALVGNFAS